ncbi:MAG: hypothetical protein HYY30_08615 [Chloroflexi bacterium]|nr:hypothetical protein [Chloroflexota bacterium]
MLFFDGLSWLTIWVVLSVFGLMALSAISAHRSITFVILGVAFLGSTILLTFVGNILLFLILWELSATIGWAIGRNCLRSFNSALGPLATNWTGSFGTIAMVVLVVLLFVQSGTTTIEDIRTTTPALAAALLLTAILFKSLGFITIAWFPGHHRVFTVSNALLATAGVAVVGLYPYLRLTRSMLAPHSGWQDIVVWTTLSVAFLFALAALKERDLFRICSFIAFGQFCVLIAGFTLSNQYARQATSVGLFTYVASVIGLFLVAGLVNQVTANRVIGQEPRLIAKHPVLGILFLILAMSVSGLPPMASFSTKMLITVGLFEPRQPYSVLWIGFWLITAIACLRAFQLAFVHVDDATPSRATSFHGAGWLALAPPMLIAALLISEILWQQDILVWLKPFMLTLLG